MYIYLIILLFTIFGVLFGSGKKEKVVLVAAFLALTIIAALRDKSVGVDTPIYCAAFNYISNLDMSNLFSTRYEPLFAIMCKILSFVTQNPQILLIISSVIIVPLMYRFIDKNSEYKMLSTYIYITLNFYAFQLTGMRQALATVILLLAYEAYKSKKKTFFLFVIIASLFHSSAIVFLALPLLDKIKYEKKTYIVVLLLIIILFFTYENVFELYSGIMGKYSGYIDTEFAQNNYFGALIKAALYLATYTYCHFYIFKKGDVTKKETLLLKLVAISVCIQFLGTRMVIFERMVQYFWIYIIVLLPHCVVNIKNNKNKKLALMMVILIFGAYWTIISIYRPEWQGVIPYLTFF